MLRRHKVLLSLTLSRPTASASPPPASADPPTKISNQLASRCAGLALLSVIAISAIHSIRDEFLADAKREAVVAARKSALSAISGCAGVTRSFATLNAKEPTSSVSFENAGTVSFRTAQLAAEECARRSAAALVQLQVAPEEGRTSGRPPNPILQLLFSEDGPAGIFYKLLVGALYASLLAASSVLLLRAIESRYIVGEPFSKVADRISSLFSSSGQKVPAVSQSLINSLTTASVIAPVAAGMTIAFSLAGTDVPLKISPTEFELLPKLGAPQEFSAPVRLENRSGPIVLDVQLGKIVPSIQAPDSVNVPIKIQATQPDPVAIGVTGPASRSEPYFSALIDKQTEINNSLLVLASRQPTSSLQLDELIKTFGELYGTQAKSLKSIQSSLDSSSEALSQRVVAGPAAVRPSGK